MRRQHLYLLLLFGLLLSSCRKDEVIYLSDAHQVAPPRVGSSIEGFYLLNEGNMGMNRATIDYFDYATGVYTRDLYSERNPNVVKELGDVGNDLKIYGSKAYAVINVSNYIEVFDVATGVHIEKINVPNCRYINFHNGKAYVSSYSGPIQVNPNAEVGFVAEIDTTTLKVTRQVSVGYQPEEMVIQNNKLYVANSGGYRVPNYDTTVAVVDLTSFSLIKKIDVAINVHRLQVDKRGDIYVSSRGDFYHTEPNLYVIDSQSDEVKQKLDIPVSEMTISGDSLYYYSVAFKHSSGQNAISYGILDTKSKKIVSDRIIKDGTDRNILIPYGIAVNPDTKEILITDAQDYLVTGFVYCYSPEGILKWKTTGGNIPAHIAFVRKKKP
ncbi:YncE family protein [Flavobacterium sp. JP2137]|uniref:YncE family protein n=1 Tax=Flavobacterium sp. JP2137 TaxID=3414510 RepID=UPI003D2FCA1A